MSRILFPKIIPFKQEWLSVGDGHELYIEQSGNVNGIPVVYLHGGPGGGSSENHRRYFDPSRYHIIVFDQRGCGQSRPSPSIHQNTTQHLIDDIETIREHLNIEQWMVSGGSWGTTLAVAYGIAHKKRVLAFILRGMFLGSIAEYQWLYQKKGAEYFFPEYYQEFIEFLPELERTEPLSGYHKILTSNNEVAALSASKAWYLWELRLSTIEHHHISKAQILDAHQAHCMAMISSHFFINNCFLSPDYLLDNIEKIANIPAILLHGRYDMVCPVYYAELVVKRWHNAQLQILPFAGHSGFESQTIDAFCKATDTMANFLNEAAK